MPFNKTRKVATRPVPGTDPSLPATGTISLSPSALPVPHFEIIHTNASRAVQGNVQLDITGNLLTTIHQNETHTVLGNLTGQIVGNHQSTVCGTCNESMLGPHIQTNVGPRNNTLVAPRTESHSATSQHSEPVSFIKVIQQKVHWENIVYKTGFLKSDAFAISMGFFPVMKMDIVTLKLDVYRINLKNKEITAKIQQVTQDIKVAGSKLIVTGALIGMLSFGTPFKPNALPRPTPITPFD